MKSPGRRSREAALLASETGQPFMLGIALATQAKIAALCGGFGHAEELAAEAERLGTPVGAATAQHARVLAAMEAAVRVTPSPSLHDGLRFARAVLAGPGEAEGLFQAALAADRTRRPFIRARTELAYGEWLRRQRRAAESRPYLRAARDTFDALGTAPWSERGRHELRTAGERSGERRAVSSDILEHSGHFDHDASRCSAP